MNRNCPPFRAGLSLREQIYQVREAGFPIRLLFHSCFLSWGGMPGRSAAPRRPERLPSSKDAPCRLVPFRAELHNSILRFVSGLLSCDACRVMHVGPSVSCGSHVMRVGPCRLRRQGPMTRELHDAKDGLIYTGRDVPGMIESPTRTDTCRHGASFVIVGTCNGPTTGGRKLNPSRLAHRGRHRECCCP